MALGLALVSLGGCGASDVQSPRGYVTPQGRASEVATPAWRSGKANGAQTPRALSPGEPVGQVPGSSMPQQVQSSVALPAPTPTQMSGSTQCATLGLGTMQLEVTPVASGDYNFDQGPLTLTVQGAKIEVLAPFSVQAIVVQGAAPMANVYQLTGRGLHLDGLAAPPDSNGQPQGPTRLSVCVP